MANEKSAKKSTSVHFYTNNGPKSMEVEEILVLSGIDFKKILLNESRSIHLPTVVTNDQALRDLYSIRRFVANNRVTSKVVYNGKIVESE